MDVNKIGIIGLGLIGGSIVKAVKRLYPSVSITAMDIDRGALELAVSQGFADYATAGDYSMFKGCQVVFLCAPVRASIAYLNKLADHVDKSTIITDVCSTKGEILAASAQLKNISFIGGHPMAGSEKSGFSHATPHLFENAYYVLCPGSTAEDAQYELLKGLVKAVGAIPVKMTPELHDTVTGSISHLPHVVASCLVNFVSVNDTETGSMKTLAAGGFRDITRIASSSPTMWQNVCLSNKEPVIDILDKFMQMLAEFKDKLSKEDSGYLYDFFDNAKNFRDSINVTNKSIIPMYFELIADIPDRPGMLGEVATMLGKENINIKNMNISNSREMEGGCLTVSFPDAVSRDMAMSILTQNGIRCYAK